jgi:hypothetical protein
MHVTRFVRTKATWVILTVAGFVLGCGEDIPVTPPPDKETSKKIAAEMKSAQMERKAAQAAQKGRRGGP